MEFDARVDGSGLTTANFQFFPFALSRVRSLSLRSRLHHETYSKENDGDGERRRGRERDEEKMHIQYLELSNR